MTRRKPYVAYVSVDPSGKCRPILCSTKEDAAYQNNRTPGADGVTVKLVEADSARDAVVRAAVAHFKTNGSRIHSNTCDICLAVSKIERKRTVRK